jgi:indole-3-glycerol phosphate synthase
MPTAVPDILARIVAVKRQELAGVRARREEWQRRAAGRIPRDFAAALTAQPPAILAEVKQASPSAGRLAVSFDPARIAAGYAAGGAAALSVLTDREFFRGSLADLEAARAACALPCLRKDFTLDAAQIDEAAAHGADAVLLIAAILTERELRDLREAAERQGMAALVEVHEAAELERALGSGARIIGVNNRNLRSFETRLETALELAPRIPAHVVRVAESGIRSGGDVRRLREAGYQAFLVGEHLMRAADPAAALAELRA